MQGGKEIPYMDSYLIEKIFQTSLPSLSDQSKYLILWLGKNTEPGEKAEELGELFQAVMGAKSVEGVQFIINHLVDSGYLQGDIYGGGECELGLSMEGWNYFDQLNCGAIVSRKVFMAMEFGNAELDAVFENCFKPAVKATGFELFRMDEKPQAGLIDDKFKGRYKNRSIFDR